jgi:lipopolysaccharide biosynthesis glycosyltransferase
LLNDPECNDLTAKLRYTKGTNVTPRKIQKHIVLLVDQNYIEPLVITLCSIFEHSSAASQLPVSVIFNSLRPEADSFFRPFAELLSRLQQHYNAINLRLLYLSGSPFGDFSKLHFNSTILNKLLIPEYQNWTEDFILFLDAGTVFGNDLEQLLEFDAPMPAPMWAFAEQRKTEGDKCNLYPSGAILLFDVQTYRRNRLQERFLSRYRDLSASLVYAEQDLIFHTLKRGELGMLPTQHTRLHFDLASFKEWESLSKIFRIVAGRDYLYWKYVGSCKPWLSDARSPLMAPYLNARRKMPAGLVSFLSDRAIFPSPKNLNLAFDIATNQRGLFEHYLDFLIKDASLVSNR